MTLALALLIVAGMPARAVEPPPGTACFLLHEVGQGERRRAPAGACGLRVTPASTFKIPHALAAVDAGVLAGADAMLRYDGSAVAFPAWRRDHNLASAMRFSVVWYFQRVAEKLGLERERAYLRRLDYGNADPSSGLTTFWLGGSLLVSAEEQARLLLRLYADELPVSRVAMSTVRSMLVQPDERVVNAVGEHPFAAPWPPGAVVSAKTGRARDRSAGDVCWLVGHVSRGARSWVFVSSVVGCAEPQAAVDLAARALKEERVL